MATIVAILWPALSKAVWWALPKVLTGVMAYWETALSVVTAEEVSTTAAADRRVEALAQLAAQYPYVPETINRAVIEAAVILVRIGVTPERMATVEKLVNDASLSGLSGADKRAEVLQRLAEIFPDMPERIGRLLVEFAVAKLQGVR